jgi:DNA modification methylase
MDHITILPVSVIDIEAQGKRKNEDHNKTSSRANYSPFPEEVCKLCYELYLRNATCVFDPFAGWGERHHFANQYNKPYIGFDSSHLAVEKAFKDYGVRNLIRNSRTDALPEFDAVFTCPPYWNLEKYAAEDGLDRAKTWVDFVHEYHLTLLRVYEKAPVGATFCIMVGDWRKNHVYYDLEFQTNVFFRSVRAKVIDKVVISRKKVSKIKIMLPQAKRLGYTVRVHENLLVFRKV